MSNISNILAERKLPEILRFSDGREVTSDNWEERRLEMLDVLSREVYGYAPPAPANVDVKVIKTEKRQYAGKGDVNQLNFTVPTEKGDFSFPVTEIVPYGKTDCPTFIMLNFRADVPDKYLPVEEILDGGCAVLRIYYNDIAFDGEDGFSGGIASMFDREKYNWGKLRMWAWAASRVMDYLQTSDYADKKRIAVVGHSRLGKTALICAAYDTRFAMACANDSGCSGDAITRMKAGERVKEIYAHFPFWFCENYQKYVGKEQEMPFDQHFLVAAIAPRTVHLGSAEEDIWADPMSQYLSACAASEAWNLLGKVGFVHPDRLPTPCDVYSSGDIRFHLRTGTHFFSRVDWGYYIRSINSI